MDVRQYVARFMVHKVGSFVVKERVLCLGTNGFSTYDPDTQMLTNTWSYNDVESATTLDGETDFAIHTPRHRIKKVVYRCHYRMEVLVCLMRLRSQHHARTPGKPLRAELQSYAFQCLKFHTRDLQSPCIVEICPDGVYQKDDEGELMSHIPYTSLVSIDLICDDHNAIVLNHSDNSSLFVVDKRTEMAQAIHRVMQAYGMQINEYRKKTMAVASKRTRAGEASIHGSDENTTTEIYFQYPVMKVSATNKPLAPRILSVSQQYIAERSGSNDFDVVISSRPLARIFSLILFADSSEAFEIVFIDGIRRTFYSPHREKLVTELLAACHALKNDQVEIAIHHVPDALRMVPCKIIQSEGSKLHNNSSSSTTSTAKDQLNAMDRELRVVQSSILHQMVAHGGSKTARIQRQLPMGIDDGMHTLALEFNANTPTTGVIAQPNKPFDKALFYVAREIRDLVSRHGARHNFLTTYLQTLYRLLHAAPAMKEFVGILLERGDGYMATITELIAGRSPVIVYWTFMVLHRLLESKTHKLQCREILLSNHAFVSTMLALFDLDPKTQRYLSDLPVMKLCQFVLCLIKTNPEQQLSLSKTLHDSLARRWRMLHRILFGFPGLATVEACVGILSRMANNPSSVYVGGGGGGGDTTMGSTAAPLSSSSSSLLLPSRAVQAPPLSMGFGEHMTFDIGTAADVRHASRRGANSRNYMASRSNRSTTASMLSGAPRSTTSASEAGHSLSSQHGVTVQNPHVLLRQYRLFLEASCGPKKRAMDLYTDPVYLGLRYRCRNVFLQELMSHVAGNFDDFKKVFEVDCFQFSGFLGKASGQKEKSELYLTPRGLIAVRVMNRSTQEFEYRAIQRISLPSENREAFAMTVKDKFLYVYSDSRTQIVEKLRTLAGVIGIRLIVESVDQLPKPVATTTTTTTTTQRLTDGARRLSLTATTTTPAGWDAASAVTVTKRSGRHGFFRFRDKQIVVMNGLLLQSDPESHQFKSYSLKDLRRVVCVASANNPQQADEYQYQSAAVTAPARMVALDFTDGVRVAYLCDDHACLLAKLYDGCLYCQNYWVTMGSAFSLVNPRLTARALLHQETEKALFLNKAGFFIAMDRELEKEIDKLATGALDSAAAVEKVLFTLENLNLNVEEDDFGSSSIDARIAQLSFRSLFKGLATVLEHASKPPMDPHQVAIILESFCRINDGCYRLASDETHEHLTAFVERLLLLVDSGDQLVGFWGVKTLHSLCVDTRRSPGHKQAEKNVRALVLGHDKLVHTVVGILATRPQQQQQRTTNTCHAVAPQPLCSLAVLHFLYDVTIKSRASTDNNHFDSIIKKLSINSNWLQRLAGQLHVVGLAVFACGLLKVTLDHTDAKAHQQMCNAALESGLTMRSLYNAIFFPTEAGRFTFRYIAGMWVVHHKQSYELLRRMVPHGFMRLLATPASGKKALLLGESSEAKKTKGKKHRDHASVGGAEWFIRRMRQEIATHLPDSTTGNSRLAKVKDDSGIRANYHGESASDVALLADLIQQEYFLPDLIWNARTREELKHAMERSLDWIERHQSSRSVVDDASSTPVVWNHFQFEVQYPSLMEEIQIEKVYLRVLVARIHDGSLQLDHVAHQYESTNTRVPLVGESGHLVHSAVEIVKAPAAFYNQVYQRWLEMRLMVASGSWTTSGGDGNDSSTMIHQLRMSELMTQSPASDEDLLMKTLIETAKVFPSVRAIPSSRVHFLMDLVVKSFESHEIKDLIDLLSHLSSDPQTTHSLANDLHLTALLFLAVLCHRQRATPPPRVLEDIDEFPVIGLDIVPEFGSVSSIPMTHLSCDSRLALRWSCKMKTTAVEDEVDEMLGPCTPFELHQHLLARKSLLNNLLICCCTIHDKHDSEDHEWRRLLEYPELRWLELVSEPIDAGCVGHQALLILRNLVVHEPSVSLTHPGATLVPLPIGKQLLSAKDKITQLVQLLLVDDPRVRDLACEILQSLGPANGPKLFEYGLFFFLFAVETTESTSFVQETKLLQMYHRVQASQETRLLSGQSYLVEMLPEPLIALLDGDSPDEFADVFTGRTTDKHVLWTPSMRKHLRLMVREHIDEFEQDLKRDVAATYRYVSLPPIHYAELSRDVYCSGYFLSTIASGEESSLDSIEEPQVLMASIEDKWKSLQQRQSMSSLTLDPVEQESASALKIFGWPKSKKFDLMELRVRYRDLCKKGTVVATVRGAYERLCRLLARQLEVTSGRTSDEVVECILMAQFRLLQKFSFQFFSYESRALPLLLDMIAASTTATATEQQLSQDLDDVGFRHLPVKILQLLLASAPLNIERLVALDGAWDTLLDMVDSYSSATAEYSGKQAAFAIVELVVASQWGPLSLLQHSVVDHHRHPLSMRLESDDSEEAAPLDEDGAVSLFVGPMSSNYTQPKMLATEQATRLCKQLERLLTTFQQRQPWQIQKLLFGMVASLCINKCLQEQLVMTTKLFWRALYLLLSTAEDVARGPMSTNSLDDTGNNDSGGGVVVALHERDVVEAAFHALRALSVGLDGASRSYTLDALVNLLPVEFLDCLDRPSGHDFWMILSTEIREPTCIWNDNTRSELMQLIAEHCNHDDEYDDDDGDDDEEELLFLESCRSYMYDCLKTEPLVGGIYLRILLAKAEHDHATITAESLYPTTPIDFITSLFEFLNENRDPSLGIYADTLPALECLNLLIDIPVFTEAFVEALEPFADVGDDEECEHESVSVATLGRYLLPFDRTDKGGMSISSRRSLSSYGFLSRNGNGGITELDGLPPGMEAEFGNVDYLNRQEYALLILNKLCGVECQLETILAPFCKFTWSLQVIADHLDYEQAFYALSCLAELCDTCLVVAQYVEQSGLWVEILGIALQSRQHVLHEHFLRAEALREPAFEVLYALLSQTKDFGIRERMYSGLGRFLPYPMVYQIHLDPSLATKFFDDSHEKSDLIWNSHWRTEVRRVVDEVICRNRVERTNAKRDTVVLDQEDYVHMPENFIAGLYLDHFLAHPDPENLTNPAYNLELLFQEWNEKIRCLMDFDLANPSLYDFLKDLAAEVEQLTCAMVHILRAPLQIEPSIEAFEMPNEIVKIVRHCNKNAISGFSYKCTLRIARRLASFPLMRSKDFLELLFCRITMDHGDIPALVKVVRRVLEARAAATQAQAPPASLHGHGTFTLKELAYFREMVSFLESFVADTKKKDTASADASVVSNVNRILRLIKTEHKAEMPLPPSQSMFQRASARWLNFTLTESLRPDATTEQQADAHRSFDVDAEHELQAAAAAAAGNPRSPTTTFNVDEERANATSFLADVKPPPRSFMFDGETIHEVPPAPVSFRFVNGADDTESVMGGASSPAPPPARASIIRATYEPIDSQYHSSKAAQYDRQGSDIDRSRRASLSLELSNTMEPEPAPSPSLATAAAAAAPLGYDNSNGTQLSQMSFGLSSLFGSEMSSSRRYSLLDSWRQPTSNQPNPLLSNMTISRRGRRAAVVFSRRKTQQASHWFK